MDRRKAVVWAVTGCVMVVAALAASSGPVRIWVNPSPSGARSVEPSGPREPSTTRQAADSSVEAWPWIGTVFNVVGVILLVLLAVGFVKLAVIPHNPWVRSWLGRVSLGGKGRFVALPEVAERGLAIDLDAARVTLSGGTPRNAIVACWMQLESEATEAGLPRLEAETSAEYAERVVALSSVDPAPIGELAALYREARFSGHSLAGEHRSRALSALHRVELALDGRVEVPA